MRTLGVNPFHGQQHSNHVEAIVSVPMHDGRVIDRPDLPIREGRR
jgi:hypothetical protein